MDERVTDEQGLKSLYNMYSNDVYRYARLTLGNSSDANDVVQEVFIRVFRSWATYRHDANEKTWIMRITRNYIFDLLRKRRTEKQFLSNYKPTHSYDPTKDIQTQLELEEALSHIKPDHRHVLILRHIECLSINETAHILGWSESKVRTTAHRALTKLRKHWIGDDINVQT